MLDYNKPTPPLPASCLALAQRFAESYNTLHTPTTNAAALSTSTSDQAESAAQHSNHQEQGSTKMGAQALVEAATINQLTINEYLPGQGIAPHTGTVVARRHRFSLHSGDL
jgi:hypothetical protein